MPAGDCWDSKLSNSRFDWLTVLQLGLRTLCRIGVMYHLIVPKSTSTILVRRMKISHHAFLITLTDTSVVGGLASSRFHGSGSWLLTCCDRFDWCKCCDWWFSKMSKYRFSMRGVSLWCTKRQVKASSFWGSAERAVEFCCSVCAL